MVDKAKIYEGDKINQAFTVQFNPNSLEYVIHSNERNHKGVQSKKVDSPAEETHRQRDPTGSTDEAVLSVRLFYHTYSSETSYTDVRDEIKKLRKFVRGSGNSKEITPKITFSWGSLVHTGELDQFSITYQMFAADGTPVQAEVSISITGEEKDRSVEKANNKLQKSSTNSEYEDNSIKRKDPTETEYKWLFPER